MHELRVLVVDDQPEFLDMAELLLNKGNCKMVARANDGCEALQLIPNIDVNLVLLDVHMTGMSGFAVIKELKKRYPELPVMIVSSYAEPQYAELAKELGAVAFLPKRDLSSDTVITIMCQGSSKNAFVN
ncbi:MAG TPA: response regulator [Firmicutes bacterium]|nr:response regulator [Bacillota bacterium]